jgi:hypothetical protein
LTGRPEAHSLIVMDYGLIVTAIRVVVAGPQDRDSIPVQDLYNQVYDQVPRAAPATSSPADVGDVARELRGTLEACLGSQGLNWQDHLQATDLDDLANYWTHRIETQTTPPPDVHSSKP